MRPTIKQAPGSQAPEWHAACRKLLRFSNLTIRLSLTRKTVEVAPCRQMRLPDTPVPDSLLLHTACSPHPLHGLLAGGRERWANGRKIGQNNNTGDTARSQAMREESHLAVLSHAWLLFWFAIIFFFIDHVITDLTVNLIFINMLSYNSELLANHL